MNFDNTYIRLFGATIFEPVTLVTNTLIMLCCLLMFISVKRAKTNLAVQWAWFFLLIGISSQFGSVAHGVQYQLGDEFIRIVIFLVNATSLIAIYFCFKAANTSFVIGKKEPNKYATWFVVAWIAVLLVVAFVQGNFLLIKIHAGIVLTYSLIIHIITFVRKQPGSGFIAGGIIISFFSILVHSLKFSLHRYFNYKDISHVIMIISLVFIYTGVKMKLEDRARLQTA